MLDAAAAGTTTTVSTGPHHGLLTSPHTAAALGWDLSGVPAHGVADARKHLGRLVQDAAAGAPQIVSRHSHPVAVLLPTTSSTEQLSVEPATSATPPASTAAADSCPTGVLEGTASHTTPRPPLRLAPAPSRPPRPLPRLRLRPSPPRRRSRLQPQAPPRASWSRSSREPRPRRYRPGCCAPRRRAPGCCFRGVPHLGCCGVGSVDVA
ncbi:type II toxin-antitoxin system Phd/YefM family antitoxin [Yinghuangia aomiensis]